ncbi:MAG: Na/Pi cotransporter family protein [Rhodobacterales bacterium]|nr:Na/Pi cotransporter family protein [Rhodobacterales bacterium]
MTPPPLDLFDLWSGLLGGLALFLFGMDIMTRALKVVAGDRMKGILGKLTRNRFVGALTGAVVTGIINSSSVTTVIMVGFISAGLVTMAQCVSVIMGANIGSTVTAQILAFKVTKLALPMVAVGFAFWFLSKKEPVKQYGAMVMGLGLVFFGMGVMSDAMKPLRSFEPFLEIMVSLENQYLGILVGALFTAIIQSSAATTGIVIVMSGQGLIALPAAIAIAFGANIGTCATAGLAAIGKPREAVRAAVVHVLFNIAGVLIWMGFIPEVAKLMTDLWPWAGAPRQIANAHTLFNVINTALFIGFTTQIARFVEWLIPDKPLTEMPPEILPQYLSDDLIDTPPLALQRARMEVGRLGGLVTEMVGEALPAVLTGDRETLAAVARRDRRTDILHRAIIDYLRRVGLHALGESQAAEMVHLMAAANSLEAIGDVVETDLVLLGRKRLEESLKFSPQTRDLISAFHGEVVTALDDAVAAVAHQNPEAQARARDAKPRINELSAALARHGAQRLLADAPNRVESYTREMEITETLKRIYTLARRMAKEIDPLEPEVPADAPAPAKAPEDDTRTDAPADDSAPAAEKSA